MLLYYNNHKTNYADNSRNPYWLAAGHEVPGGTGAVLWSQPEIALYNGLDAADRPGYPDFIEHLSDDGKHDIYITETQKAVARIHLVQRELLAGLFNQRTVNALPSGPAAQLSANTLPTSIPTPNFPAFQDGEAPSMLGFAIMTVLDNHQASKKGDVIMSSLLVHGHEQGATPTAHGVEVKVGANNSIVVTFGDGSSAPGAAAATMSTDTLCTAVLNRPGKHFWAVVADGGARIITMMVDGVLCDGGGFETQGQ